jgi:hypothetical protein
MRFLHRGLAATALALAAAAALIGVNAGTANAASQMTVRLAPVSNPFLTVEVRGASYDNGATVDQWTVNGGSNQIWNFIPVGDAYEIVNVRSGKCLTTNGVAGATVYQITCLGALTQLWYTGLQPGNLIGYSIKSKVSGLYLEVFGASGAQGANIDTWYGNAGDHQYFLGTPA